HGAISRSGALHLSITFARRRGPGLRSRFRELDTRNRAVSLLACSLIRELWPAARACLPPRSGYARDSVHLPYCADAGVRLRHRATQRGACPGIGRHLELVIQDVNERIE